MCVCVCAACLQDVYEQLVEREKRVKGQEASVSTALGERERSLQAREDECLATDRQLTADRAAVDRARLDPCADHEFHDKEVAPMGVLFW